MMFQHFKKSVLLITLMVLLSPGVFAACGSWTGTQTIGQMCESNFADRAENPVHKGDALYLICPIYATLNIGIYLVGAAIIIMVSYGAIKAVMAVGDPKGLQGARLTWTWAIFGALIILFAYTIITIVLRLVGVASIDPASIGTRIAQGLDAFICHFMSWIFT